MKESLTFAEKDLASLLQALQTQPTPTKVDSSSSVDLAVVITGKSLGHDNEHLGTILMKFFLQSLVTNSMKPKLVVLMSDGIFLACEESEVLGSLTVLQEQGIKILVEGTSVDYFQVEKKIKCGKTVSMLSICSEIMNASRVIVF